MNKKVMVKIIADRTGLIQKDVNAMLNQFCLITEETLIKGGEVRLIGFGTFKTKARATRYGRNPRTGEIFEIPASVIPVFRPGKALKDNVNG